MTPSHDEMTRVAHEEFLRVSTDNAELRERIRALEGALEEAIQAVAQARAEEREACAKAAESYWLSCGCGPVIAKKIRARAAAAERDGS